jgi:hypothetical protein
MFVNVKSITIYGITPMSIDVEVDVSNSGNPKYTIVGLPDKAVEESMQRVMTAIKNTFNISIAKKNRYKFSTRRYSETRNIL